MNTKKTNIEGKGRPTLGFSLVLGTITLLILGLACQKSKTQDVQKLTPYVLEVPTDFPQLEVPEDNKPYAERIELGRKLYYDLILSNNGLACASCHLQKKGFTAELPQDMPVLPHVNMAWKSNWMWDGSKRGSLEDVMLFEVDQFFGTDISKLNRHAEYPALFAEAYGVEQISSVDVARALAQFTRVLISANSKYDKVQASLEQFTDKEARGFAIFTSEKSSCYHCHTPPLFTDNYFHNTGLDSVYNHPANRGYYNVTGDSSDLGRFRTPTLRNLSLRESYMHDGRFTTIKEVVEFYNQGVKLSPQLDPTMIKQGHRLNLNLTTQEIDELVAFLKTLTDSTFINSKEFSKPE